VVVVTGSRAEPDTLRALELGAVGYMTKPFDFGQLARVVGSCRDLWISIELAPSLPVPAPAALDG
jgi:CheY-like chemotaxis protein